MEGAGWRRDRFGGWRALIRELNYKAAFSLEASGVQRVIQFKGDHAIE